MAYRLVNMTTLQRITVTLTLTITWWSTVSVKRSQWYLHIEPTLPLGCSTPCVAAERMSRLLHSYLRLLNERPILTKSVTSGTLFGLGDCIAQYADGSLQRRGYSGDRTLKAVVWGGVIFAPAAHVWYNKFLERVIPGATTAAVLKKVVLDQTLWSVAVNSVYLTYATLTINHGDLEDAKHAVTSKMWTLMKANWMVWPAVQLINFKLVPGPLQVPFINVVALGWSAFLAVTATSTTSTPPTPTAAAEQDTRTRADAAEVVTMQPMKP